MTKFKWFVFTFLLCIFLFFAYMVSINKIYSFDNYIYNIVKVDNNLLTCLYKFVTLFSSPFMIILICFLSFFIDKKYGFLISTNAVLIFLFNYFLKLFFARPRPYDLMMIFESGYSFPSGHAMLSLAFYGFIIFLIDRINLDKSFKVILKIFLGIFIFLIGMSRIYLGVHYPSDVCAGFTISGAYLIVYISIVDKYLKGDVDGKNL